MEDVREVIRDSTFNVIGGKWKYVKAKTFPKNPSKHFMISYDGEEITIISKEENISELEALEVNKDDYGLIALNVSIPFYSIGFLAKVSGAIASKGMNILIVSTFSKDYILVKSSSIEKALKALNEIGLKEA